MLKIEHVSKTFNLGTINEKKALIDINLQLDDGDFVTVIGGNEMIKIFLCIQNINVQVLLVVYSRIR